MVATWFSKSFYDELKNLRLDSTVFWAPGVLLTGDKMDRKRRNTSSPEADSPQPKRSRQASEYYTDPDSDTESMTDEEPRLNTLTGQKGAFPGLGDEDEIFYGPASDGIEYLRMVR